MWVFFLLFPQQYEVALSTQGRPCCLRRHNSVNVYISGYQGNVQNMFHVSVRRRMEMENTAPRARLKLTGLEHTSLVIPGIVT